MKKMKNAVLVLVAFLLFGLAGTVSAEGAWIKLKADYQASFTYDLEDVLGFNINRARIGAVGSFAKNFFFEISVDGKYTQKDDGTELKKAYLKWDYISGHSLSFGAVQIAFTRPISGTEFNFINYDITSSVNSYQYGLMLEGRFANVFSYSAAVCNGEGLRASNIGTGLLYSLRLEFLKGGIRDFTDGAAAPDGKMIINASLAAAVDNKADTVDNGVTYEKYNGYYYLFDFVLKTGDLAVFAQLNYNMFDRKEDGTYWGGTDGNSKKAMGGYAQISYNLRNVIGISLEPTLKYEFWRDVVFEGITDVNYDIGRVAVGLTWYVKGHDLKFNLEYRLTTFDNRDYFIKAPSDHFVGIMATHKFGSGKIGL